MKTEVIMYRKFIDGEIRQMSKSGYLCATDITRMYNVIRNTQGLADKDMKDFFTTKSAKDFMLALCKELNLQGKSYREQSPDSSKATDLDAQRHSWEPSDLRMLKRGKKNEGTWLHPYLFMKYAMWLSPEFEVKIIAWATDNLLEYRNQSGDEYKALCRALDAKKLANDFLDYVKVAQAITMKIMGSIDKGTWDSASEAQLQQRRDIEKAVTFAINGGLVSSISQVLQAIKNQA